MSNPALLSRQEMLGSSGKCLNHFCIIYSRYLASSNGNEFSIWKRVTECPRQEINLRSLSLKTDLGSLNTPNPILHRITAPAASWTRCSFTHSSPLLRQGPEYIILQDSSKNHIFLILGTASPISYINIVLCTFWSALADIFSLIWLNAVWVYSLHPSLFYHTGPNSPSPQQGLKPLSFSVLRELYSTCRLLGLVVY